MATIVEVPGVGQVEFPDSMGDLQIKNAIKRMIGPKKPSMGQAFTRAGTEEFTNNLMKMSPLNGAVKLMTKMTGQRMPDASDIFAGAQVAGETAGALRQGDLSVPLIDADYSKMTPLPEARQQQMDISKQFKVQRPMVSDAGELVGDAATLVTGRAPIAQFLARNPLKFPSFSTTAPASLSAEGQAIAKAVIGSKPMKFLASRAGRSLETGLEGAAMAIMNDGDPLEVGAYAAGGQAVGSLFTPFVSSLKGLGGLAGTAIGLTALFRLGQDLTPGIAESLYSASDSAFNKIKLGLALGIISGVGGAGRLRGTQFGEVAPVIADSINAMQRGVTLSLLTEWRNAAKEGNPLPEAVMSQLSKDPGFFGKATHQLEKALTSEGVSFTKTLENLMQNDEEFGAKVDSLLFSQRPPKLK